MPWRSVAQARWGHSPSGLKALGGPSAVAEWDNATPKGSLPEKVGENKVADGKHWIKKAIRHPGALTRAAKKSGRSKKEEARHEAQSSNPHIRARGLLGERLMGGEFHRR